MYTYHFEQIPTSELYSLPITGGPEYATSVYEVGVLEPILATRYQGSFYLIAGNRRIASLLAAYERAEAEGTLADKPNLHCIDAKVYEEVPPDDQRAWSLIENEDRSDNIVDTWRKLKALQESGYWDEIRETVKINRSRENKFKLLNSVDPVLIQAYENGECSGSHLFEVARLPKERQAYVVQAYQSRTGKDHRVRKDDISAAKWATNQVALAAFALGMEDVPEVQVAPELFVAVDPSLHGVDMVQAIGTDFQEVYQYSLINGNKMYKLVAI